jgi:response regulator NasT
MVRRSVNTKPEVPAMSDTLRVSIADDNSTQRASLKKMLESLGHTVVSEARTDEELVRDVQRQKPDVAVADLDVTERDASATRAGNTETPLVVTADHHEPLAVSRALSLTNVVGYLARPFGKTTLDGMLRFASGLFRRFRGLQSRLNDFERSLSNREVIEKAKQIVMQRMNLTEPDAHRRLQKLASSSNKKLAELAQSIVEAEPARKG